MAKMKKVKMTDEEVLKHYVPCEEPPPLSPPGADVNPPDANVPKPEFIKAVVDIDRIMAGRKTAVIKTNQRNTKKWRKSPTKKH
jgi:hypothetical protein